MAEADGPATPSLPPAPGTVVAGRYTLLRELGEGGMGRVYEAHDAESGQRVALKLMLGSRRAEEAAVERFRREAEVLAAIDHPNVAAVRDFGEDDGTLYLVMELIDGPTVGELLRARGPLDADGAAPLVAGLCAGLVAAHARGVIHRDLKPGNVVLVGGDPARPKLVDFGVARADWLPAVTVSGTTVGTPRFMAPEQLAGLRDLDARADVYAAGLLVYFVLTGRDPFPERNDELLPAILTGRGVPLGRVRPEVPVPVEAVVHRAIAHVREARYSSAAALGEAYAAALDAPASARPVEPETVPLRPPRTAGAQVIPTRPRRKVEKPVAAGAAREDGSGRAPRWTIGLLLLAALGVASAAAIVAWPDGDPPATGATPLPRPAPDVDPVDPVELSGPMAPRSAADPAPEPGKASPTGPSRPGRDRVSSTGTEPAAGGPEPTPAEGETRWTTAGAEPVAREPSRPVALLLEVRRAEGASIADVRAAIMARARSLRACVDAGPPDLRPPYAAGVYERTVGSPSVSTFVSRRQGGDAAVFQCMVGVLSRVQVGPGATWEARVELR